MSQPTDSLFDDDRRFGLTTDERTEVADVVGQIVAYFASAAVEARRERDALRVRVERLEALIERYRFGVSETDVAVDGHPSTRAREGGAA